MSDIDAQLNKITESNIKLFLEAPSGTQGEYEMGRGTYLKKIFYVLLLTNIGIVSHRMGRSNCNKLFWGAVVFSLPVTHLISKYMFGVQKFRLLEQEDRNMRISNEKWNQTVGH